MLCTPVTATKLVLPGYFSEKLNGIRAIWNPHTDSFQTRHGKFWRPWMTKKIWSGLTPTAVPLDGEFFVRGKSLQYITSAASVNLLEDPGLELNYHVYDCVVNGETFDKRRDRLNRLLETCRNNVIAQVAHLFIDDEARLEKYIAGFKSLGAEGVVNRVMGSVYAQGCRSPFMQKLKFMHDDEVLVINCIEGKGKFAGTLGAMSVVSRINGKFYTVGGGTMNNADRAAVWASKSKYIGKIATVEYPYKSEDGIPLQAVFVAWRDYE